MTFLIIIIIIVLISLSNNLSRLKEKVNDLESRLIDMESSDEDETDDDFDL
ncbi:MAG: hypothetical protein AAB638_03255 [Patescibacteria group bacterium]